MRVRPLVQAAVDLLYPPRCAGCGRFGDFFCRRCEEACIPASGRGRCPHCSARWDGSDNCPRCFELSAIEAVAAVFEMTGPARQLVHRLKYSRMRAVAPTMARHLCAACHEIPFDYAVAVPLHPSRLRYRGFNQAAELLAGIPHEPLPGQLRRVIDTGQQVGRNVQERRRSIRGAFAYNGPDLDGASILLVDDVVTTGATVNACTRVLQSHGAARIVVACFARTSYQPETLAQIDD